MQGSNWKETYSIAKKTHDSKRYQGYHNHRRYIHFREINPLKRMNFTSAERNRWSSWLWYKVQLSYMCCTWERTKENNFFCSLHVLCHIHLHLGFGRAHQRVYKWAHGIERISDDEQRSWYASLNHWLSAFIGLATNGPDYTSLWKALDVCRRAFLALLAFLCLDRNLRGALDVSDCSLRTLQVREIPYPIHGEYLCHLHWHCLHQWWHPRHDSIMGKSSSCRRWHQSPRVTIWKWRCGFQTSNSDAQMQVLSRGEARHLAWSLQEFVTSKTPDSMDSMSGSAVQRLLRNMTIGFTALTLWLSTLQSSRLFGYRARSFLILGSDTEDPQQVDSRQVAKSHDSASVPIWISRLSSCCQGKTMPSPSRSLCPFLQRAIWNSAATEAFTAVCHSLPKDVSS